MILKCAFKIENFTERQKVCILALCKTHWLYLMAPSGLLSSDMGTGSHLKCKPQLNPPRTIGEGLYTSVSALMMSMTGQTTVFLFSLMGVSRGWSHASFTSQWLSRNTNTSPEEKTAMKTALLKDIVITTRIITAQFILIISTFKSVRI